MRAAAECGHGSIGIGCKGASKRQNVSAMRDGMITKFTLT